MGDSSLRSSSTFRYYSLQAAIAHIYATSRRYISSLLFSSSSFGPGYAPRPGDSEISIPWISKTLIADGTIPRTARILSVECKGLDGNRGLVGAMNRVLVSYIPDSSKSTEAAPKELHLILKRSRDGYKDRLGNILSGQTREAIFYSSDLAKELVPKTLLPKIYYAYGSQWLGEYVILMEDVKQRHGSPGPVDVNFVFGNQIWGIPPTIDRSSLPSAPAMLEHMFLTAAETHAQHWNDRRLLELTWLKTAGWYHGLNRIQWEWSVQAGAQAWEMGKAKATKGDFPVKYSEKFVKILDEAFERASWDKLQQRLQDKSVPFTLAHGDFHAANMILDRSVPSSSSITLYDWSEVGVWEPTTDLGQTVISDMAIPIFQEHARPALKKYWERLVQLGVVKPTEYTFETCWRSFLRGGIEKWLWMFGILSSYPGLPAPGVQYFHDQLLAFIEMAEKEGVTFEITTVLWFAPPSKS
ncbi:hypothetical protein BCR41DRAFT_354641 [Lobosporangium transversale]|uniref:Aminoglycoside phosphotransferase domain-containing protein n=1 Tax=Lobosporangium transversale TaxID=64571 RepID=A0A1Y2GL19_9FUNG|nr:hypothetical protein BCR41DRAFT_354641 [Lobosporangium transversale]ORZ14302.1 hypothetical protein BCR41DRAFT_354641 [Lobosporangium transversale]|eukprot:XP_021880780.1 hypothetical protein BCR41DRAFT_354641 [Lobosporangium transversale]